jgi:hypothetical protein
MREVAFLAEYALREYQRASELYDRVFEALIPEDLRVAAMKIRRRQAYDEGLNVTVADDWKEYTSQLDDICKNGLLGCLTGYPSIDLHLNGLSGLIVLGGSPGVGKTSLALSLTVGALATDPRVAALFLSFDMSKSCLLSRMWCASAGVDYRNLVAKTLSPSEFQLLKKGHDTVLAHVLPRLRITDGPTIRHADKARFRETLEKQISELLHRSKAATLLLVVDYFQLLPIPDNVSITEADYHRIELLQGIQEWIGRYWSRKCVTLAISELRKEGAGAARGVYDFLGSVRIPHAADTLLALEPVGATANDSTQSLVTLKILKGRDGVERATIPFIFEHTKSQFREQAEASTVESQTKPRRRNPFGGASYGGQDIG